MASVLGANSGQIGALLQSREPLLILVNGETERIGAASRNRITALLFDVILAGAVNAGQPGGQRSLQRKTLIERKRTQL
jgi:hypothetical protein